MRVFSTIRVFSIMRIFDAFLLFSLCVTCYQASQDNRTILNNRERTSPAIESDVEDTADSSIMSWLRWTPSTLEKVREAEKNILDYVETSSVGFFVNIGLVRGEECRVWTRKFGADTPDQGPLVMVHGMGAGLALFVLNYDSLATNRTVYALDLPGFGRSSRINFPTDPQEVESQYTLIIEKWRQVLGIEKMNLLGHSFGGYLTGLFTLQYPQHIKLCILADPWGMTHKPSDWKPRRKIPEWAKALGSILMNLDIKPLWGLRASGPAGPWLVKRLRPDIMKKFEDLLGAGNTTIIADYLYHCNAQDPTGEAAFNSLTTGFIWPKLPLLPRLNSLDKSVAVQVFYGANTWMTHLEESDFIDAGMEATVDVEYFEDAGHHVYADQYNLFNQALDNCLSSHDNKSTDLPVIL